MQLDFPVFERRIGKADPTGKVTVNPFCRPVLRMFGIEDHPISVDLEDIDKDGIRRFEGGRLFEQARIIKPIQKGVSEHSACHPMREESHRTAYRMTEMRHCPLECYFFPHESRNATVRLNTGLPG
jgi:hypothetical protein